MTGPDRKVAAVIGGGPAGLMAAEQLVEAGIAVEVYDRMPTLGRKFLMAGRGGLNLTHSEPLHLFMSRYGEARQRLEPAVSAFPPDALRAWCEALGQPTFVGSSGRVFPVAMKASPLLRAWLQRLSGQGVRFATRHRWIGWTDRGALRFETSTGSVDPDPDAVVMAMGGASWPGLGSDGRWSASFGEAGVPVRPFLPSNCGLRVPWTDRFRQRFEGQPLKGIELRFADRSARGDCVVTAQGLEGGPVYAISPTVRDRLSFGPQSLMIRLRPDLPIEGIGRRLGQDRGSASLGNHLRKRLGLSPLAIGLLYEACHHQGIALPALPLERLAALIDQLSLPVVGTASLDRAISSAGGVTWGAVDGALRISRSVPTFVAGEMLDWEAPTGGYLLQAALATGRAAGQAAALALRQS